jgi:hypothetical protein
LVSPGGLLIIEDLDITGLVQTGSPAIRSIAKTTRDAVSARGGDLEIGQKLESIISSLEGFEQVHVEKMNIPFDGSSPGELLQHAFSHPRRLKGFVLLGRCRNK